MTQMPEKLTARDNSAVKLYRKLARSKKERYREGLFVLEGHRLVTDALRSGASFTHLFWTEEGYTRWNQETIQADLRETRCALLSNELGTDLSQTEHSQGVYAICRMPRQPELSQLIRPGGIYAVLHQLQDPGNAGMILRTADAMGLDGVIYSASCDIYSPKVVRATMGSLFRVPVCCTAALEPVLEACREAGVLFQYEVLELDVTGLCTAQYGHCGVVVGGIDVPAEEGRILLTDLRNTRALVMQLAANADQIQQALCSLPAVQHLAQTTKGEG